MTPQTFREDEDWTKLTDKSSRRRIQNRISQRNRRRNVKLQRESSQMAQQAQQAQQTRQVQHQRHASSPVKASIAPQTPPQFPLHARHSSAHVSLAGSPAPPSIARSDDPFSLDYYKETSKDSSDASMNCFVNANDLILTSADQDMADGIHVASPDLSYSQLLGDWSMPVAINDSNTDADAKNMHDLFSLGSGQTDYSPWSTTVDPTRLSDMNTGFNESADRFMNWSMPTRTNSNVSDSSDLTSSGASATWSPGSFGDLAGDAFPSTTSLSSAQITPFADSMPSMDRRESYPLASNKFGSRRPSESTPSSDMCGLTTLHLAVRTGHVAIVRLLLETGLDIDSRNEDGQTSLHLAVSEDNRAVVQLLLEEGAGANVRDKDGRTTLHLASSKGHLRLVELLLQYGADAECRDCLGHTALHQAVTSGHEEVVRLMLDRGADARAKVSL